MSLLYITVAYFKRNFAKKTLSCYQSTVYYKIRLFQSLILRKGDWVETKQYGQPRRRKKRRKVPKKRRTGLLIRLRQMSWYNLILVAIVIIGFYLIGIRLYRLWEIHDDMNQTLQQEQTLRDENLRLRERRDKLNDPDEIAREAREQFGLAKPDEIPYKP